mgnify:CR=1 FL=1
MLRRRAALSGSRKFAVYEAHLRERPLHRDRIRLDEQLAMQVSSAIVRRLDARRHIAGERRRTHLRHQLRARRWRVTEITPCPPISISWQRRDVVAAVDGELGLARRAKRLDELAAPREVRRSRP